MVGQRRRTGIRRNWQWYRSRRLVEPHGGVIVAEFFDIGQSRSLPWRRRPEASAMVKALRDPNRGFGAVVIGEPHRASGGLSRAVRGRSTPGDATPLHSTRAIRRQRSMIEWEMTFFSSPSPFGMPEWTPQRQQVHKHLEDRASPLAGLYASAIFFLVVPTWPGRHYLLGHAVREIAQRLPDFLDPQPRTRADDAKALKSFVVAWSAAGLPVGVGLTGLDLPSGSFPEDGGNASADQPMDQDILPIPLDVAKAAASLVEIHLRGTTNNYSKAASIILTGGHRDREVISGGTIAARDPTVLLWINTVAWFMEFTHISDKQDKTLPPDGELVRRFKVIEDMLESILSSFYQVIDDLDKYLAIANAPVGSPSPTPSARLDHSPESEGDPRD